MIPQTAEILRHHIELNCCSNVCVFEGALAPVAGQLVSASIKPGHSGASSIAQSVRTQRVVVQTITFANILRHCVYAKLIKMDIEGAKIGALDGLGSALEKVENIISGESNCHGISNYLRGRGFQVTRLDSDNAMALCWFPQ